MRPPACAICDKPLADGAYACTRCAARARGHLLEIGELIGDARAVAYGLDRSGAGVGAVGVPGSRVPLDLHAGAKLDAVHGELATLARMVGEERGMPVADVTQWDDPIEGLAVRLAEHLEWMRHHPAVDEHLAVIAECARVVRGTVNGPAEKRYLGPCGAPLVAITPEVAAEQGIDPANAARGLAPCDGDVYGRPGAERGTCRTCGARVDQDARRAWLDDEVRQYAYTAKEIADAYGINIKTIRSWRDRGRLAEHGNGFYNLGEVLDLAAKDAARREETRAKRQRDGAAA